MFTVEVWVAINRPPTKQVCRRFTVNEPDPHLALLMAISAVCQTTKAEMPVEANIIDWEE